MMQWLTIILTLGLVMSNAATIEHIDVNGTSVPVVYEQDERLPIVSMQLVFQKSGSIEDGNASGLARLTASMLNEGSKARGSTGFAKALDARAIRMSVHAGTETLVFEMEALKEEFDEGTKLLYELISDPNFTDSAFDKVKTTTIGGLSRKESDFDYVANRALKAALFAKTPLANPASGTIESVKAMTLEQVTTFATEHLKRARVIVVIGGDIEKERAKSLLTPILAKLPQGELDLLPHISVSREAQSTTLFKTTEQAYVYFGAPYAVKVGDVDQYISRVAMFILGSSGFGSRMMEEIRVKRGLAYSAYCRANVARSSSYFFGYLQTKIASQEEAVRTVRDVIAEYVKNGATQEELDQAKRFLLGSEPLRVETLSQRLSRTFMEYYKGLGIGASERELEQIEALSLKSLNAYIKRHTEINQLTFAVVSAE